MHIKFEENRAWKMPPNSYTKISPKIKKRHTQKKKKNANEALTKWVRIELALVYQGTPMLVVPLKGWLALVYHGTPKLASHSFIFAINTPTVPFGKIM